MIWWSCRPPCPAGPHDPFTTPPGSQATCDQRNSPQGLLASPASAELDDTTISVAVAQGNAHCLIETKTMSKEEALSMAQAFIASDGISDKARDAVTSRPEFSDLMNTYIADQGGCKALVKQLQQ